MLFLAGFLEHVQKGFLSTFLYVLSSMYHQEVRQREKTLISNVIPEQIQEASLLQIDCHVIISFVSLLVQSVFRLTAIGLIRLVTVDMKLTTLWVIPCINKLVFQYYQICCICLVFDKCRWYGYVISTPICCIFQPLNPTGREFSCIIDPPRICI